jgi:hypothetical protein
MDRMSYKERMEVCRKIKLMLKGVNVFDQRKIFWYLLSRSVKGQGLDPRFKSIDHHKDASAVEKVVSDFCTHLTDLFSSYPLNAEATDFPVFPFHKFAIAGNRLPKEFSLQHFRPSYRSKEIIDTQRDEYKTYYILDFPEFYLQVHDATSGAWNGSFRMRNVPSERFYPDKPTLFILRWSFSNSPFEDRKDEG